MKDAAEQHQRALAVPCPCNVSQSVILRGKGSAAQFLHVNALCQLSNVHASHNSVAGCDKLVNALEVGWLRTLPRGSNTKINRGRSVHQQRAAERAAMVDAQVGRLILKHGTCGLARQGRAVQLVSVIATVWCAGRATAAATHTGRRTHRVISLGWRRLAGLQKVTAESQPPSLRCCCTNAGCSWRYVLLLLSCLT
jgi:hypothetical protein